MSRTFGVLLSLALSLLWSPAVVALRGSRVCGASFSNSPDLKSPWVGVSEDGQRVEHVQPDSSETIMWGTAYSEASFGPNEVASVSWRVRVEDVGDLVDDEGEPVIEVVIGVAHTVGTQVNNTAFPFVAFQRGYGYSDEAFTMYDSVRQSYGDGFRAGDLITVTLKYSSPPTIVFQRNGEDVDEVAAFDQTELALTQEIQYRLSVSIVEGAVSMAPFNEGEDCIEGTGPDDGSGSNFRIEFVLPVLFAVCFAGVICGIIGKFWKEFTDKPKIAQAHKVYMTATIERRRTLLRERTLREQEALAKGRTSISQTLTRMATRVRNLSSASTDTPSVKSAPMKVDTSGPRRIATAFADEGDDTLADLDSKHPSRAMTAPASMSGPARLSMSRSSAHNPAGLGGILEEKEGVAESDIEVARSATSPSKQKRRSLSTSTLPSSSSAALVLPPRRNSGHGHARSVTVCIPTSPVPTSPAPASPESTSSKSASPESTSSESTSPVPTSSKSTSPVPKDSRSLDEPVEGKMPTHFVAKEAVDAVGEGEEADSESDHEAAEYLDKPGFHRVSTVKFACDEDFDKV